MAVERSWNVSPLPRAEPQRRNRRTIDGAVGACAAIGAGLGAVAARSAPEVDEEIGNAIATALGWAPGLWRAVLIVTLALAVLIVVDALWEKRWLLARDLLLALLIVNLV